MAFAACGDDGNPPDGGGGTGGELAQCAATGAGTLVVHVEGLPTGVDGKVTITGPSGPESVTQTKTFTGAAAGSYTATAETVTQPDPIVRTVYSPTIDVSTVCLGDVASETLTISYKAVPTSNKLWLSNSNSPNNTLIEGFASSSLGESGSPAATVAATTTGGGHVLFDKEGNLWATVDVHLLRHPATSLDSSGAKTPDLEINIPSLNCVPAISGMAFDASGNLWVASPCLHTVQRFTPAQLAASGEVTPEVVLSVAEGAQGVAFDKTGNLWVTTPDSGHLLRFDASSLGSSAAVPALTLSVTTRADGTGAPLHPGWLAFDSTGALWSGDFGGNVLFPIPSTDLGGTGEQLVVPPAQITVGVSALIEGMAFDEGGGLWVSFSVGKFVRLSAEQLTELTATTGPGEPTTPERIIASPEVGYVDNVAFYPAPANLPIYSALP